VIHAIVGRILDPGMADVVHVRDKESEARRVLETIRWFVERGFRVVVNTRADLAIAAGAAGVHLPSNAPRAARFRGIAPPGFLVGVSCHSREVLLRAEADGADYAYLSPVFPPKSKADGRPALGWAGFALAVRGLRVPVLALGGLTRADLAASREAGAAGIAGISLAFEK
jgi:thiamine-phosphate pyrophosphorylase